MRDMHYDIYHPLERNSSGWFNNTYSGKCHTLINFITASGILNMRNARQAIQGEIYDIET